MTSLQTVPSSTVKEKSPEAFAIADCPQTVTVAQEPLTKFPETERVTTGTEAIGTASCAAPAALDPSMRAQVRISLWRSFTSPSTDQASGGT